MNAGNSAAGSTPAARTRLLVYEEIVRTASTRRSAARAIRSASGAAGRRARDPYSLVAVRQSPWISTTTGQRGCASTTAAASYGLCTSTASGRNAASSRRTRSGSDTQKRGPSSARRGGAREKVSSRRGDPSRAEASTRSSSSARSAANLRSRFGSSGSR